MDDRSRFCIVAALLLGMTGCVEETAPPAPAAKPASDAGRAFDSATIGTIEGQVRWQGPRPEVPELMVLADAENPPPDGKRLFYVANPYAPQVDGATGGVREVVVFLRGVDPEVACSWPHGTVRVEQVDRKLQVIQGGSAHRIGLVRRGDEVEVVNRDPEFHALRGRGAAFFSLPFTEKDAITRKRLDQAGVVDLSSAAGYFWMQAKLLVVDHPYCAQTDVGGHFRLEQVPPGNYEMVCWMPSWEITQRYRDPESGLISRLAFAPPVEQTRRVEVAASGTATVLFTFSAPKR